jgi:hypothetical protein
MIFPKSPFILGLIFFWGLQGAAPAQQKAQNPAPSGPEAIQKEDKIDPAPTPRPGATRKVAAVRAWYIGSGDSPRITLACSPTSGDPMILGSYMPSGRFLSYRPIRPGSYTIHVLEGSVVPSPTAGKISVESKNLAKLRSVELAPGSFNTLVIRETDGKFSLEELPDKKPGKGTGPLVRILNFSGDSDLSIRLVNSNVTDKDSREIWKSSASDLTTLKSLSGGNPYMFLLDRLVDGAPKRTSSFEATLVPSSAFSLIIYPTAPGRIAMRGVRDAVADFSSEEIKELASE